MPQILVKASKKLHQVKLATILRGVLKILGSFSIFQNVLWLILFYLYLKSLILVYFWTDSLEFQIYHKWNTLET